MCFAKTLKTPTRLFGFLSAEFSARAMLAFADQLFPFFLIALVVGLEVARTHAAMLPGALARRDYFSGVSAPTAFAFSDSVLVVPALLQC